MAYGLHANGEAFNDLLTDIDELILKFVGRQQVLSVNLYVQAHQSAGFAADGRQAVDSSKGVGIWGPESGPGDSWRDGLAAMEGAEPVDSKPNNRAARRRAARGL